MGTKTASLNDKNRHGSDPQPAESAGQSPQDKLVEEASEESFPASDAPSWTPTTGLGPAAPADEREGEAEDITEHKSTLRTLAEKTRAEYEAMKEAMHRLEAALASPTKGREREWCSHVVRDLGAVYEVLQRHAESAEADQGLFFEVRRQQDSLTEQLDQLGREHAKLLEKARALQMRLQYIGDPVPVCGEMRREVSELLSCLRQHQAEETDLVFETFLTDIGSGRQ